MCEGKDIFGYSTIEPKIIFKPSSESLEEATRTNAVKSAIQNQKDQGRSNVTASRQTLIKSVGQDNKERLKVVSKQDIGKTRSKDSPLRYNGNGKIVNGVIYSEDGKKLGKSFIAYPDRKRTSRINRYYCS